MAEHAEAQALKEAAERRQRSARSAVFGARAPQRPARSDFPPVQARPLPCIVSCSVRCVYHCSPPQPAVHDCSSISNGAAMLETACHRCSTYCSLQI